MSDKDLKEVRPSLMPTVLYTVGCITFVLAARAVIRGDASAALILFLATALCFAVGYAVHRLRKKEEIEGLIAEGRLPPVEHGEHPAPVEHEPLPQSAEPPEIRP